MAVNIQGRLAALDCLQAYQASAVIKHQLCGYHTAWVAWGSAGSGKFIYECLHQQQQFLLPLLLADPAATAQPHLADGLDAAPLRPILALALLPVVVPDVVGILLLELVTRRPATATAPCHGGEAGRCGDELDTSFIPGVLVTRAIQSPPNFFPAQHLTPLLTQHCLSGCTCAAVLVDNPQAQRGTGAHPTLSFIADPDNCPSRWDLV